jgi:hypothetical protein
MKKILIGAIVGALFLAGLSLYLMFKPSPLPEVVNNNGGETVTSKPEAETVEPFSGVDSMFNLLSRKGDYECTLSMNVDSGVPTATEGTFFFRNGKLRSDTVTKINGQDIVSSTIVDGDNVYSWTAMDGFTQGIKMKISESAGSGMENAESVNIKEMESLNTNIKYDCKPWTSVDDSVFEIPDSVLFKDMAEIMDMGMEYGTVYEDAQASCASCNTLTGDLREQCRVSLQCQ